MIRRWLIRGCFMSVVTLCVVAWLASYSNFMRLSHNWPSHECRIGVASGLAFWVDDFQGSGPLAPGISLQGWYWETGPADYSGVHRTYAMSEYRLAGFGFSPFGTAFRIRIVFAPMWFFTLLSLGLL
jgi:hypothetical protein